MVTKERGRRLERKAPERKTFWTDANARCVSRNKAFEKIFSPWRGFFHGQFADLTPKGCIARQGHPAAVGVNTLKHLKTKEGSSSERADASTTIAGADSLRAVLNNYEVMLFRKSHDLCHRAWLAIKMCRDDCAGLFSYNSVEFSWIHIEACWINIHENGS